MIPHHPPFRIKPGQFIRHGDDSARVSTFLRADAHWVLWDPEDRGLGFDGGVEVRVAFDGGVVVGVYEVAGHHFAEVVPVGVFVGEEELS